MPVNAARYEALCTSARRAWKLFFFLLLVAFAPGSMAQGIESIMSPGKLSRAHAKYEDDCTQCHVKFDRQGQDKRCLDCHKETRVDVDARTGFHGKMKPQTCRNCHTEHKGLDTRLYVLDKDRFDHKLTDYPLQGKHQKVLCDKCHVTGKLYREAPSACNTCHRKDDTHKGSLGQLCADCHNDASWKETKFDHSKTHFELTGKHADVKCAECHRDNAYKDTPEKCFSCHKKDDEKKGHKGIYGEKCESCHDAKSWKTTTFKHDQDTKYVLNDKHRTVKCSACHTTNPYREKTSQACVSCHRKDDKHKDSLGKKCETCHSEKSWTETLRFDHAKSDFPLLGKHVKTECKSCHEGLMYKQASKDCFACHKKDDKHVATLGQKCADCHTANDWKATLFEHDKTRFRLKSAHAVQTVKCEACHKDVKSFRDTPMLCISCHKKDDKHEGQIGSKCEACHSEKDWKVDRFDHNRARFALTGGHALVVCKKCHDTPRFRDARRDCVGCHIKEDKHKRAYGVQCESCHNTRAWPLWDFAHDTRTHYKLDGAHRTVPCEKCHRDPAPAGKLAAPLATTCYSCHRESDPHDGKFGSRCQQCHVTQTWKKIVNRFGQS